ncbi:MAG: hypothetical protein ACYCVH_06235 [Ignavibacteriaceae bacterium]
MKQKEIIRVAEMIITDYSKLEGALTNFIIEIIKYDATVYMLKIESGINKKLKA